MYCKVSSYKIAATVAVANKNTMFTACAKAIGFSACQCVFSVSSKDGLFSSH